MTKPTAADLARIMKVRGWFKGWNTDVKITREDVGILLNRIDDLDVEEFRSAEEIVRFTIRRLEEELTNSRAYLLDMIEQTRCAELLVREAEHALAAMKALLEGPMFASGTEINARWDAMLDLYGSQGMLPAPEPVEAAPEPPVEPEAPPEPEPVPPAAPSPPEPLPPHLVRQRSIAAQKALNPPMTAEEQDAAVFASLKVSAGEAPEIQVSLAVLAAHSGVPKGSLFTVLERLASAKRIEIIRPANVKGTKPPNTYRFVVEEPAPEPAEEAEPVQAVHELAPEPAPTPAIAAPVRAKPTGAVAVTAPLRDRIVGILGKASCTTSGLASMLDVKELAICQTLTAMEHEGTVKADEMPEGGRRAQLWRLPEPAAAE